jgi:hypothetical protein
MNIRAIDRQAPRTIAARQAFGPMPSTTIRKEFP